MSVLLSLPSGARFRADRSRQGRAAFWRGVSEPFTARTALKEWWGEGKTNRFTYNKLLSPTIPAIEPFLFGDFVNSVVSFVIIAAAVYFTVVLPMNTLMAKIQHDNKVTQPSNKKCPECLSEIPIDARRCAHCTQPVG